MPQYKISYMNGGNGHSQPDARPIDEKNYTIAQDFTFAIRYGHKEVTFIIRRGFITDIKSVPALGRILVKHDGVGRAAGVIHDYIARHNGVIMDINGHDYKFTRDDNDLLFREALKYFSLADHKIWLSYNAVWLYSKIKGEFNN